MYIEIFVILFLIFFIIIYRKNNGEKLYKYISSNVGNIYNKYAPYSYKVVREKTKQLGQEFTIKQYITQASIFGIGTAIITYLYFYNIIISIIYVIVVIALFIPYLAYLRTKKAYSEFIFEQVQVYCTNVIMEFNTTQSFVKALEGVRDSGVLEDPLLSDINEMIRIAYNSPDISESITYMNNKYDYYMVKNMHQLFYQITKEGSKDSGEALEGMQLDIDMLVENVYRDRIDRQNFHKQFVTFGIALYFLIGLVQYMLGNESYLALIQNWYIVIMLHAVILINSYFLISGEKYYNEDVGAE